MTSSAAGRQSSSPGSILRHPGWKLAPPPTLYVRAHQRDGAIANQLLALLRAEELEAQLTFEPLDNNSMPGPAIYVCTRTAEKEFDIELRELVLRRTVILVLFEPDIHHSLIGNLPPHCSEVWFYEWDRYSRSSVEFQNLLHACRRSMGVAPTLGALSARQLEATRQAVVDEGLVSVVTRSAAETKPGPELQPNEDMTTRINGEAANPGQSENKRHRRGHRTIVAINVTIAIVAVVGLAALLAGSKNLDRAIDAVAKLLEYLFGVKLFNTSAIPMGAVRQSTDIVDASVFAPNVVPAEEDFLVQVFLHRLKDRHAPGKFAAEHDADTQRRGIVTLATEITRGQRIDIALDGPYLSIEEPNQYLIWQGNARGCQFVCRAPSSSAKKSYTLTVRIIVESVPVGALRFTVKAEPQVECGALEIRGEWARRYEYAFLSYASDDRVEVLKRAQALKAAKIGFFQDLLTLEPGERWHRRLFQEIDRCDLFLLFWSSQAAQSDWVRREAEYALGRRNKSENEVPDITPVILEGPPIPSPPDSLKEIHFNDALRFVIAAAEAHQSAQRQA